MPIDTRFLKQAKDQAGALKRSGIQFVKGNPRTATSAAAAMLLAPLLLKNDNQNYAQTAAFTSPLIAAGALAVSQMAPTAGNAADNLYGTYNAQREYRQTMNATEVTYSDIKNAQKAYEDQKIALAMFQNMKRRFYAGRRRGKGNVTREAESLTRMVEDNLTSEQNLRYLSNSIHAERLRTGSAGELAN